MKKQLENLFSNLKKAGGVALISGVIGFCGLIYGNEKPGRILQSQYKLAFVSNRNEEGDPVSKIDDEIYVVNEDGSNQTRLTRHFNYDNDAYPCWSPDGKKIIFVTFKGEEGAFKGEESDICFVDVNDTKRPTTLISTGGKNRCPQWSPDGKRFAFVSDLEGGVSEICVADIELAKKDRFYQITRGAEAEGHMRWSPDGEKIAFISNRDKNLEIYVVNVDGSGMRNLTNYPKHDIEFCWSPDSKQIAFTSSRKGNSDIYVVNVDGSGLENLINNPANDMNPVYSPDKKKIAFISDRDKNIYDFPNYEIYVMNADGTEQRNLTKKEGKDEDPQWSPDGKKIAFVSDRVDEVDKTGWMKKIYIIDVDGSNITRLNTPRGIEHFRQPRWSPVPISD